ACVLPENPASYRVVRTKSYLFNKANEKYSLCEIFSKVIPTVGNMDSLEACLHPLKTFFIEQQAKLEF
ncbi:hypothetical protein ACQJ1W_25320, partial [Klebsiella pneumoniae]